MQGQGHKGIGNSVHWTKAVLYMLVGSGTELRTLLNVDGVVKPWCKGVASHIAENSRSASLVGSFGGCLRSMRFEEGYTVF